MKEYTLIASFSVILTVLIDRMTGVNLLKRKLFYLFLFVILGFKFLVNGYLTGSGIVMYNKQFFLGVRIGSIPLEDFLFGFSMVCLSVIFWEFFKRRMK
ncbi:MAG: lycopene cyclase domain-containing protein [Candidatus Omnitrophica bacterium]|nr:lycopene cyclase domain-containing protein [Candidatus Omnitrophota bacterium]MDD5771383.1 lycopene cyclase domain-containing protein [Candidatus Omnitrophota bacterium]